MNFVEFCTRFAEVLATRGGSVFLLIMCTASAGLAEIICLHYHLAGEGEVTIRNSFVGFSGALLMTLTSSKTPPSPTPPSETGRAQ